MSASPKISARYEWLEMLGQGQEGTVCKCKDIKTNKMVAMKRVYPSILDVPVLNKTLEVLKAEPHEHIASLIRGFSDFVEETTYYYIVFEFAPGETLLSLRNREGPLSIELVRNIMRQVVSGVDHMHNVLNCAHRDIKLENIVFKNTEKTKIAICDLGLALRADLDKGLKKIFFASRATEYFSYEVWREQRTGKPQDMWALGVLTYKLLCESFPFEYMTMTEVEMDYMKMGDEAVADLQREAIVEIADIVTRDAISKIKKGVNWASFPKEYAVAKNFIRNLLLLDHRYTAEDAKSDKFLLSNIQPSSSRTGTFKSSVSGSAGAAAEKASQKDRHRSSSSPNTPVPPKSGTQLRLRGGGGSGDSGIEKLPFLMEIDALSQSNWKVWLPYFLAVRAGISIRDGEFRLEPYPRTMAETAIHRRNRKRQSGGDARLSPTIPEEPALGPGLGPNIPHHAEVERPASADAREQTPPPPPTGPAPAPAPAPASTPARTHTPSPPPQTRTSSPAARTNTSSPHPVAEVPPPAPSPPPAGSAPPSHWRTPSPSSQTRTPSPAARTHTSPPPARTPTPSPSPQTRPSSPAPRTPTPSPPPVAEEPPAPSHPPAPPTPAAPHQVPLPLSGTGSAADNSTAGSTDNTGKQVTAVTVSDYSGSRSSSLKTGTPRRGTVAGISDAGSVAGRSVAGSVTGDRREESGHSNHRRDDSVASSRRSGEPTARGQTSSARSGKSDPHVGGQHGRRRRSSRKSAVDNDVNERADPGAHKVEDRTSGMSEMRRTGSVASSVRLQHKRGDGARDGSVAFSASGSADHKGKGKEREQSGAGAGAEQDGQPGPSKLHSHSHSQHKKRRVVTPIPPGTTSTRVPSDAIDKAIENSRRPYGDQRSISTLEYGNGSSSGNADHKGKGKEREQSGAGTGAEQDGQPGPSKPHSHSHSQHKERGGGGGRRRRHTESVETPIPPGTGTTVMRVPSAAIDKAIENSRRPVGDQRSISTLEYGNGSSSGNADHKGKGKEREQSGAGAGAEQDGQPGPSKPHSHSHSQHKERGGGGGRRRRRRHTESVETPIPPGTGTTVMRVPSDAIDKAIENSRRPYGDQRSISTLEYGNGSPSRASRASGSSNINGAGGEEVGSRE